MVINGYRELTDQRYARIAEALTGIKLENEDDYDDDKKIAVPINRGW